MIEVGADDASSAVPNTGTWSAKPLNTATRHFDISVAGKCKINPTTHQLGFNITGSEKIPDFFTLNSLGEIVFAEPKTMCTIKKPRGEYEEDIFAIQLKKVSTEEDKFKDYICLGVRENGIITERLHVKNPYCCISTKSMSEIELVPLISKTKVSDGYEKVEAGTKISATSIPFPANGSFNLGTVYRVKVGKLIEWERHECNLPYTGGDGWGTRGYIGVGSINNEENQFVVMAQNTGKLACSHDCITWYDAGSVYNDTKESSTGWLSCVAYGNNIWCAVNTTNGEIRYSDDGAKTWKISSLNLKKTIALAFGNDEFMIVSDLGQSYTSPDGNEWLSNGTIPWGSKEARILMYGNNKWICGDVTGQNMYHLEKGKSWTPVVTNLASFWRKYICGGCYVNRYFYVIENYGAIIRSSDGINWTKVSEICCGLNHYNIAHFNGKLYVVSANGTHCHIGTLDPDDVAP